MIDELKFAIDEADKIDNKKVKEINELLNPTIKKIPYLNSLEEKGSQLHNKEKDK